MTEVLDLAALLGDMVEIAGIGAAELAPRFGNLSDDDIELKDANDLVSVADRASEAAMLERIAALYPGHAVLAEESGASGPSGVPTWVIDPLDGTANFVHGVPMFAVSVAVVVDSRPLAGVVVDPLRGTVWRAARGLGSWQGERRLRLGAADGLSSSLVATGFPFRVRHQLSVYMRLFEAVFRACRGMRRCGAAALDLALVASGSYDLFFEFGLSPWDIAAGVVLIEEAGGSVCDLRGGETYMATGDIAAGVPGAVQAFLEIAAPLLGSAGAEAQ